MAKERPDFKENKKKIMDEITAEGEALLESVGLKEKMNLLSTSAFWRAAAESCNCKSINASA